MVATWLRASDTASTFTNICHSGKGDVDNHSRPKRKKNAPATATIVPKRVAVM
jgi:hypothetical protein